MYWYRVLYALCLLQPCLEKDQQSHGLVVGYGILHIFVQQLKQQSQPHNR